MLQFCTFVKDNTIQLYSYQNKISICYTLSIEKYCQVFIDKLFVLLALAVIKLTWSMHSKALTVTHYWRGIMYRAVSL